MFALDAPNAERQNMNYSFVGTDYIETLDVKMAAGRDFSRNFPTDTAAVVLNAAAAKKYGLSPTRAVGRSISFRGRQMDIIGVTENFHYESLHTEIYPLLLFHESFRAPQYVAVRVAEGREAAAVERVRETWQQFADVPFRYSFLASDLAAQYEAEQRLERLFVVFAGLAILIACLGLFGLAAYSARQRTKEIGLRKALGATTRSVITLVSADFLKLVGIAFLLAAPAAYLALQQWLASYAYRIDIGPSIFAFAGVLAVLIAAATVSTQAWRAARVDPTTALRSE
jgi:putative ABC transport system permease protein